jgi:5-formyltetrahydrofolate cyclo-ligase
MLKQEIRQEMRARRRTVSADERAEASAIICAKLAARADVDAFLDPLETDSPVAVYLASRDEIDLHAYIEEMLRRGRKVVAPRWNGETYDLAVLKGLDAEHLRRGPMGILEPAEAKLVQPQNVFVWIVPGLAFTRDGHRLGYGGGWYDRFLSAAPKDALRLGVAYSFQIVDNLPVEPHDIPLTAVIDDSDSFEAETGESATIIP